MPTFNTLGIVRGRGSQPGKSDDEWEGVTRVSRGPGTRIQSAVLQLGEGGGRYQDGDLNDNSPASPAQPSPAQPSPAQPRTWRGNKWGFSHVPDKASLPRPPARVTAVVRQGSVVSWEDRGLMAAVTSADSRHPSSPLASFLTPLWDYCSWRRMLALWEVGELTSVLVSCLVFIMMITIISSV